MTTAEENKKKQKGKMRLLHDKEVQVDKLSYDEYLKIIGNEFRTIQDSIASESIPILCTKIKREYPLMDSANIRMKVIKDCSHWWTESTIRHYWPKWMKNEKMSEAVKQQWIDKRIASTNDAISQPQPQTAEGELEEENASTGGMASWDYEETHPKTEKSPMEWLVETNRSIARLFQLLTDKPNMPTSNKDIKLDIIKPTRPFIQDMVNGIPKDDRIFLHNWLVYLNHVIRDRIDVVEKADKTAYDTRED